MQEKIIMYLDIIKKIKELNIDFQELEHAKSNSCEDSKAFRQQAGFDGI
jgi:hypothetical protein